MTVLQPPVIINSDMDQMERRALAVEQTVLASQPTMTDMTKIALAILGKEPGGFFG